MKAATNARSD